MQCCRSWIVNIWCPKQVIRSKALTCEISRQGSLPTWAPVKPYTEFALILRASCRPSSTCFLKGSVSFFSSALALQTDGGITQVVNSWINYFQLNSSSTAFGRSSFQSKQFLWLILNNSNLFRADSRFSRISGRSPFLRELFTKRSPVGVLMKSSGARLNTYNRLMTQLSLKYNINSAWIKWIHIVHNCSDLNLVNGLKLAKEAYL